MWNRFDISILSPLGYEAVKNSLDGVQQELAQEMELEKVVLGSVLATSVGLSAGYVVWLLKGGSLLASVLSSMPAWQLADPLSILVGRTNDDEDDETLEDIIETGSDSEKRTDSGPDE